MKTSQVVIGLLVIAQLLSTGCQPAQYTTPERYREGLVIVLGGAGGITTAPQQMRAGLDAGGVPYAIEIYHWSSGSIFSDQQDIERNRRLSARLARKIEAYQSQNPNKPVHMLGLSAGSGIMIFTLECLKEGRGVDTAVLLASSVSDNYDLTLALKRVKRTMVNFSSHADLAILGFGVGLVGTVDRAKGFPAGRGGFQVSKTFADDEKQLYKKKLRQVSWEPTRILEGHLGNHLGGASFLFVRNEVAPIMLAGRQKGKPEE